MGWLGGFLRRSVLGVFCDSAAEVFCDSGRVFGYGKGGFLHQWWFFASKLSEHVESMIFLFPRWDMLIPWMVLTTIIPLIRQFGEFPLKFLLSRCAGWGLFGFVVTNDGHGDCGRERTSSATQVPQA